MSYRWYDNQSSGQANMRGPSVNAGRGRDKDIELHELSTPKTNSTNKSSDNLETGGDHDLVLLPKVYVPSGPEPNDSSTDENKDQWFALAQQSLASSGSQPSESSYKAHVPGTSNDGSIVKKYRKFYDNKAAYEGGQSKFMNQQAAEDRPQHGKDSKGKSKAKEPPLDLLRRKGPFAGSTDSLTVKPLVIRKKIVNAIGSQPPEGPLPPLPVHHPQPLTFAAPRNTSYSTEWSSISSTYGDTRNLLNISSYKQLSISDLGPVRTPTPKTFGNARPGAVTRRGDVQHSAASSNEHLTPSVEVRSRPASSRNISDRSNARISILSSDGSVHSRFLSVREANDLEHQISAEFRRLSQMNGGSDCDDDAFSLHEGALSNGGYEVRLSDPSGEVIVDLGPGGSQSSSSGGPLSSAASGGSNNEGIIMTARTLPSVETETSKLYNDFITGATAESRPASSGTGRSSAGSRETGRIIGEIKVDETDAELRNTEQDESDAESKNTKEDESDAELRNTKKDEPDADLGDLKENETDSELHTVGESDQFGIKLLDLETLARLESGSSYADYTSSESMKKEYSQWAMEVRRRQNSQHTPNLRYHHTASRQIDSQSGRLALQPEYTFTGGAGSPHRNALTPPMPGNSSMSNPYQHPTPLSKDHVHPFRSSPPQISPDGVSQGVYSSLNPSVRSLTFNNDEGELLMPVTYSPPERRGKYNLEVGKDAPGGSGTGSGLIKRGRHDASFVKDSRGTRGVRSPHSSSNWLSTLGGASGEVSGLEESLDRRSSFSNMMARGPTFNVTGTPEGTGRREVGSSLADYSSPYMQFDSSPNEPYPRLEDLDEEMSHDSQQEFSSHRRANSGSDQFKAKPGRLYEAVRERSLRHESPPRMGFMHEAIRKHRADLMAAGLFPRAFTPPEPLRHSTPPLLFRLQAPPLQTRRLSEIRASTDAAREAGLPADPTKAKPSLLRSLCPQKARPTISWPMPNLRQIQTQRVFSPAPRLWASPRKPSAAILQRQKELGMVFIAVLGVCPPLLLIIGLGKSIPLSSTEAAILMPTRSHGPNHDRPHEGPGGRFPPGR